MHIVIIKSYDIYVLGKEYIVERTLGARLCEMKVAVPYSVYLDNLAKAKAKAAEAKKKAEADKKAKLLKEKEEKAKETAESKSARTRSKSTKK